MPWLASLQLITHPFPSFHCTFSSLLPPLQPLGEAAEGIALSFAAANTLTSVYLLSWIHSQFTHSYLLLAKFLYLEIADQKHSWVVSLLPMNDTRTVLRANFEFHLLLEIVAAITQEAVPVAVLPSLNAHLPLGVLHPSKQSWLCAFVLFSVPHAKDSTTSTSHENWEGTFLVRTLIQLHKFDPGGEMMTEAALLHGVCSSE